MTAENRDPKRVDWETLNAYVDRELPPAAAASVAAAIARDPDLAARVASLANLKANTSATLEADVEAQAFPAHLARLTIRKWAAIAAALVVLLASFAFLRLGAGTPHGDLTAALAAEQAWLAGPEATPGRRVQVSLPQQGSASLPDLSAARLRLTYVSAELTASAGHGVFAGYVGPHGCRLGLWIAPGRDRGSSAPIVADRGATLVRTWSFDRTDYALLSPGMDPRRLDRFAQVVAQLIRRQNQPGDDLRVALQDASAIGEACKV